MAFECDRVLYTHAGVTHTWALNNLTNFVDLAGKINGLFVRVPCVFRFTPGVSGDNSGDDWCQTPIWVRPGSLLVDRIPGVYQVVGHTPQGKVREEDGVYFVDAPESNNYLEVTGGVGKIKKIK